MDLLSPEKRLIMLLDVRAQWHLFRKRAGRAREAERAVILRHGRANRALWTQVAYRSAIRVDLSTRSAHLASAASGAYAIDTGRIYDAGVTGGTRLACPRGA